MIYYMMNTDITCNRYHQASVLLLITVFCSCSKALEEVATEQFELLSPEETGVLFRNDLQYDRSFNVYTYRNYYNGGGVSVGDINNDGLIDIYFTANLGDNKLYLNKGDFRFEDITDKAGVAGKMGWSTGVTMADVNGDGWLDIYVCNSGELNGDKKENELFINNKDLSFSEQAAEYGLNDRGYSTHASFFDYDKDGDLDVYLLNNSYQAIGSFNLERKGVRQERDSLGGDKLLRNTEEFFEDVSTEAGIYGSVIGFGLGVTIGDVNRDDWEDIYVSNDFFERDYLYVNNQDGTFSETLTSAMKSISGASMGADLADINNDGYPDLFVTEMLPRDDQRLKTVTTFENWDKYQYNVQNDYYHQFTRNTFQLNSQDLTFHEIGRMAGVEASDWSWGALIFDMNNDGLRDLYVANGVYQDLTNQDYLNYISNEEIVKSIVSNQGVDYKKLIDIIPSNPVSNKAFLNKGQLEFEDATTKLGLDSVSFSNGSAYGDLDNDGDLDIVVNNVNMPSFIYRNNLNQAGSNWIRLVLKSTTKNTFGFGAKIIIAGDSNEYYTEQQPTRGFQSSVDPRPLIGLGAEEQVDVEVRWPSGKISKLSEVAVNQTLEIAEPEDGIDPSGSDKAIVQTIFTLEAALPARHIENQFVDFYRDRLLYHMNSTEGPKLAVGDVNQDGFEDLYLCGAKDSPGQLILGGTTGFSAAISTPFDADKTSEDSDALFFDADGDGDLDLYVCSGGSEFSRSSSALIDRLYFNDGNGNFLKSDQYLPTNAKYVSTSTVEAIDYDQDGDLDLFVGERMKPFQYGMPCDGYLLQNYGEGQFSNVTSEVAPELKGIGMVTSSVIIDVNGDKTNDLVLAGEYMPITVFINSDGKLERVDAGISELKGWWSAINAADIDNDGDMDLIGGNHGTNSRFKASHERPLKLYFGDFDKNGFQDPILTFSNDQGNSVPYALRHNLADQLKFVLKRFPDYESYRKVTIQDVLDENMMASASTLEVNYMKSAIFINDGKGTFSETELPLQAQMVPIYAIASDDLDDDGDIDLLLGGNLYKVKPEVGRYDASFGIYVENLGNNKFKCYPNNRGFIVDGEIRDIRIIGDKILVARNNDTMLSFKF